MEAVLRAEINKALASLGLPLVDFAVEHPAELAHGDYACNVAMVLAKAAGKAPRVLAEEIKTALEGVVPQLEKIEIAGPGFLNFYLTRDFFTTKIDEVTKKVDDWGRNDSWSGKRVFVEYTDANPFKEFHIGHLFTNAVGESIARLFMMNGADTKRINYQGDVGLHVAHAIWGMQQLGLNEGVRTARELGRAYALGATTYKTSDQAVAEIRIINKKIYDRSDEEVNKLYDAGRKVSLSYFETIYDRIDTKFDGYFFESEAGPVGKELVLSHPEVFVESDGAYVFKGEDYGLHTRVFLNKEGLPTYEAKELALAKMKEEKLGEYDLSIISTANEVSEYFKVLKKAMSFVYPDLAEKTEHIGHGMVRLTTGKMSSRTGDVISASDFIDEVAAEAQERITASNSSMSKHPTLAVDIAIAAIKYATLRGSILQNSIFDKEKALSFEGDSGPYLQYTHARISSVAKKAEAIGIVPSTSHAPAVPYAIERTLYRFPEVIAEALNERAPHKVTTFITDLAGDFNSFYGQEKIADAEDEYAPYKLALALAVKQTIKNGLWVLGMSAPEEM